MKVIESEDAAQGDGGMDRLARGPVAANPGVVRHLAGPLASGKRALPSRAVRIAAFYLSGKTG